MVGVLLEDFAEALDRQLKIVTCKGLERFLECRWLAM
jgi:hypothetical protein